MSQVTTSPIAIDARLIGYTAGIARYATELIHSLGNLDGTENYIAFVGRKARAGQGSFATRIQSSLLLTPPHHQFERKVLPAEILARTWGSPPSLLHSTDHVVPAWGPWKRVVTLHDLAFITHPKTHNPASLSYYRQTAASVQQADAVIAVSRHTADAAIRLLNADPRRLEVIYEAPHLFLLNSDDESGRQSGDETSVCHGADFEPFILCVGTVEPRKNYQLLLRAMALMGKQECHLVIAGALPPGGNVHRELARELGIDRRVHWLGRVSDAELAGLYRRATVCAVASLTEGFGLPVLEAMTCGVPVVASNVGSIPEAAGGAALLLPPEDPGPWADALLSMLREPRMADELRRRGRARARQFSWQRTAEETREVYRTVLRS